jgi:bifunctional lysine-specific demethylase and histidyl-hydroxylase NO66
MSALQLLSGDAQSFLEKVWAVRTHLHRGEPGDFEGLLSFDDVDALFTSTALRTPALRIAKDGSVLPSSRFTRAASIAGQPLTGLVDARKVLELFSQGATVVLQGLHRYWPPLTLLVRELELELGHPCQANAYLTPPGSQGFAVHRDSHDVFVFQSYGVKQWQVYDDGGPHDVLLEPGLSMYLPAGTPHAARAQETASLHVTIGINQVTWKAVLERAVSRLLANAELDTAIPAGYLDDPRDLAAQLGRRLESLGATVTSINADDAATSEVVRFLTSRNAALRGGLHDSLDVDSIADGTRLRRRPGTACALIADGDRLRVLLGDRELRVPRRLTAVLEEVRRLESLRPADLAAWLDPESRLVLCRRLVREGLLRVDD